MMDYRRYASYVGLKNRAQKRAKASQKAKQKEQQFAEAAKIYTGLSPDTDGNVYKYFKNMVDLPSYTEKTSNT